MDNRKNGKKSIGKIPLSVLDLATILAGKTPSDTFQNSLDLARHVEKWDYRRYWLAEHHNMQSIASSATSVLIGYIAGGTSRIRVGSGGIMLPNHAPLVVAEQFGTLETLYPGRIDLGLGRAPGTDHQTAMALRREHRNAAEEFPQNVQELRRYFSPENSNAHVRAIPGEGLNIPVWLLGSSSYSAQLAAALGLPFAFASHFAPNYLHAAIRIYRDNFRPSESLKEPYVLTCVNVVAADTDDEAQKLVTSLYLFALNVLQGTSKPLRQPVDNIFDYMDISEKYAVEQMFRYSFVGGPEKVKNDLQLFLDSTQADELMVVGHIYDHQARLRSYEILHEIWNEARLEKA